MMMMMTGSNFKRKLILMSVSSSALAGAFRTLLLQLRNSANGEMRNTPITRYEFSKKARRPLPGNTGCCGCRQCSNCTKMRWGSSCTYPEICTFGVLGCGGQIMFVWKGGGSAQEVGERTT